MRTLLALLALVVAVATSAMAEHHEGGHEMMETTEGEMMMEETMPAEEGMMEETSEMTEEAVEETEEMVEEGEEVMEEHTH